MTNPFFDSIPEDRRDIARSGISAAFGRAQPTGLEQITHGASGALIYRLEVAGRPYLLRLETKQDSLHDRARGYACMQTAAETGIAPPLHFADSSAGVAIMDLLPSQSLFEYPTGRDGLLRDLGALVARLQATPTFPAVADYPVIIGGMLDKLSKSRRFMPGLLNPHQEGLKRLTQAYAWDKTKTVSSHNDLNPGNIIFDGKRLWFVDWEVAFRNDPLIDLANLSNYLAPTPALQDVLLQSWLGREPDHALRARLVLARQFVRLAYACLMLSISDSGSTKPDGDPSAPSLTEFHTLLAQGRVKLSAPESLYVYGKVYLSEFLANLAAPDFEEALAFAQQGSRL